MKKPNLFNFATSELSQDAFLCYLFNYAKEEYRENIKEYKFANFILKEILKKCDLENLDIKSLDIKKQFYGIDILLIINEKNFIIIEDKTNTNERNKQLEGYRDKITQLFSKKGIESLKTVYYKTGDESLNNIKIKKKNIDYVLMREEILKLMGNYDGDNIIINDYIDNLKNLQNSRENFKNKDLRNEILNWNEIHGFYNALDQEFDKGILPEGVKFNWGYTANQNGGFMCYYFSNVVDFSTYGIYSQIEATDNYNEKIDKNKLFLSKERLKYVVKVWSDNRNNKLLYPIYDIFKEEWQNKIKIKRSSRFVAGSWMSVLIIEDYLSLNEKGKIDVKETALNMVNIIKEIQKLQEKFKDLEK